VSGSSSTFPFKGPPESTVTGYCSADVFWLNRENVVESSTIAADHFSRQKVGAKRDGRRQLMSFGAGKEAEKRPFWRFLAECKDTKLIATMSCGFQKSSYFARPQIRPIVVPKWHLDGRKDSELS
jgi:hypothetical protein